MSGIKDGRRCCNSFSGSVKIAISLLTDGTRFSVVDLVRESVRNFCAKASNKSLKRNRMLFARKKLESIRNQRKKELTLDYQSLSVGDKG